MARFLLISLAKFYQNKEEHIIYFLSFYLKKEGDENEYFRKNSSWFISYSPYPHVWVCFCYWYSHSIDGYSRDFLKAQFLLPTLKLRKSNIGLCFLKVLSFEVFDKGMFHHRPRVYYRVLFIVR